MIPNEGEELGPWRPCESVFFCKTWRRKADVLIRSTGVSKAPNNARVVRYHSQVLVAEDQLPFGLDIPEPNG